ncbi:MAG: aldo/keto reductase [Acidobacteria bacterium]|nr:aldo/keto reductase [Acidobacteriota bacterium]
MEKRRLGKTDIEITPIGLGCWQFAQGSGFMGRMVWDAIDQEVITSVIGAALRAGVNWFDTAEGYGNGMSEKSLAAGLAALGVAPGSVGIATKWWPLLRTAGSIGATVDARIGALSPYPIDLHQVHQPISLSSIPAQMREMAKLVRAGKVRAVGVSNFSARQMEQAHAALAAEGIPLASNQVRFNLLDRAIESNGILETARRLGITIIAYSPLAQGMLTGRFHEEPALLKGLRRGRRFMSSFSPETLARTAPLIDELRSVASVHGVSVSQVALGWTIAFHGKAIAAIPGATRPSQATASAAAMGITLSEKELSRIDEASRGVARHRRA